jgi:hypothetical protein
MGISDNVKTVVSSHHHEICRICVFLNPLGAACPSSFSSSV